MFRALRAMFPFMVMIQVINVTWPINPPWRVGEWESVFKKPRSGLYLYTYIYIYIYMYTISLYCYIDISIHDISI